jgi:hypothetical protein
VIASAAKSAAAGYRACLGCGATVPDIEGPTHRYVPSAPGCWAVFGEIHADEMARFGYPEAHRLVVDAYMAQHPGDGNDRRDRQSVFVHLVGLCAALEFAIPPRRIRSTFGLLLRDQPDFPVLQRTDRGTLTVLHVCDAADLAAYEHRSREWASAVWATWEEHHPLVRSVLLEAL